MNFEYKDCKITLKEDNKITITTKNKNQYYALKQEGFEVYLIEVLSQFLKRNSQNITLLKNKSKLLGKEIVTLGYCYSHDYINETNVYKFKIDGERYYFTTKIKSKLELNNYYLLKGKLIKDDYYNRKLTSLEKAICYEEYTFEAKEIQKLEFEDEVIKEERPRYEFHLHTVKSQRDAFITNDEIKRQFDLGNLAVCAITDHGIPNSFPDSIKAFGKSDKYNVVPAIELYVVDDELLALARESWEQENEAVFDKKKELQSDYEILEQKILDLNESLELEEFNKLSHEESKIISMFESDKEYKKEFNSQLKNIREIIKSIKSDLKEKKAEFNAIKKEIKELEALIGKLMLTEPNLGDATRFHVSILVKSKDDIYRDKVNNYEFNYNPGIYELNKAITISFTETFGKTVLNKSMGNRNIVTLSALKKLKATGYFQIHSACSMGLIGNYIIEKKEHLADRYIELFDAIEIQPIRNNTYLIDHPDYPDYSTEADVIDFNKRLYEYAIKHNKPCIFTSDAHIIEESQAYKRAMFKKSYISMIVSKKAGSDLNLVLQDNKESKQPFFHTYSQMVKELKYQGFNDEQIEQMYLNEKAIGQSLSYFNNITIIPKQMFIPDFKGIDTKAELMKIIDENAKKMYGPKLDPLIQEVLDDEIKRIFGAGYDFCYYVSMLLVKESEASGYPVGSRGSVGSSVLAMFTGITTNNPLPPHYYCNCGHLEWKYDEVEHGLDLPDQQCPQCNKKLKKDGFSGSVDSFIGADPKKPKIPDKNLCWV